MKNLFSSITIVIVIFILYFALLTNLRNMENEMEWRDNVLVEYSYCQSVLAFDAALRALGHSQTEIDSAEGIYRHWRDKVLSQFAEHSQGE